MENSSPSAPLLTRRRFLGAAAGAAASPASSAPRRPNLVFVLADQLRYQSCGYAGDALAQTPHIDHLAREAVNLRQPTVSHPVCAPYRATLMTGKYSSSTGMVINELRLSPEHECIRHVLIRAGYQTALIGKWHLWANQLGGHERTENGFVPPGAYRLGFDHFWAAYNFNRNYYQAPYFRDTPQRLTHPGYEPDSQTEFLLLGPPHDPWTPDKIPPEDLEAFRDITFIRPRNFSAVPDPHGDAWVRMGKTFLENLPDFMRVYYAQTRSIDRAMGRLAQALEELNLSRDTILVFTSDHGEMFGAHGRASLRSQLTAGSSPQASASLAGAPKPVFPRQVFFAAYTSTSPSVSNPHTLQRSRSVARASCERLLTRHPAPQFSANAPGEPAGVPEAYLVSQPVSTAEGRLAESREGKREPSR